MSPTSPGEIPPVPASRTSVASSGVTTTPARFDSDAQQSAAATLPRAIDVKAIDDCTVEGSSARNTNPVTRPSSTCPRTSAASPSPTAGNTTKVVANTSPCNRQWVIPAQIAWGEIFAP